MQKRRYKVEGPGQQREAGMRAEVEVIGLSSLQKCGFKRLLVSVLKRVYPGH